MAWVAILKFAGEKLGKAAAEHLIKEFGGQDAARLKKIILGKDEETKLHLQKIDKRLEEMAAIVKDTELRQIFTNYNTADAKLEVLLKAYQSHASKPADDDDKQGACRSVLSRDGAFAQGRHMISALCHVNKPKNKSFLQEYSEILEREFVDVFSYCDRMDALLDHLRISLAGAAALRELCLAETADPTAKKKDAQITKNEMAEVDRHFLDIVTPARHIKAQFESLAENGEHVLLQHCQSGKYLTAYKDGTTRSGDDPFAVYAFNILTNFERHGMPAVYLYDRARGRTDRYTKVVAGYSGARDYAVTVTGASQEWKVVRYGSGADTVVMLQHRESALVLDGTRDGCIYVNPLNSENKYTWWQPVVTKNAAGVYEKGVFLLKHKADDKVADGNGKRVYASDRSHSNPWAKWRVVRDLHTLESGDHLLPGEAMVSANGAFALCYAADGGLSLVDLTAGRAVWHSDTAGKTAWRCLMQADDGHLVVYEAKDKPVWATGRHGGELAGSRAILHDDGTLEIVTPTGEVAWRKTVNGTVA